MNSTGRLFRITTFGESHGNSIGLVIDGCPPGINIDFDFIYKMIEARSTAKSFYSSQRVEPDQFEVLSGFSQGRTNGHPIGVVFKNKDARPSDYKSMQGLIRPGHADYTYQNKYGDFEISGGGRASARETLNWVFAGAIALQILNKEGINILAWVSGIGNFVHSTVPRLTRDQIYDTPLLFPDESKHKEIFNWLEKISSAGDTCGGSISGRIENLPVGLGEPIFDKLHARLAQMMMTINATRAFELGEGVLSSELLGSEMNDIYYSDGGIIKTRTNHNGGIAGGISNGMPVEFKVTFKPVSSVKIPQSSVTLEGNEDTLIIQGRHDVCVVPRAVPIVEAMAAITVLDFYLLYKAYNSVE